MKTIQKILILALVALALVYFYNITQPPVRPKIVETPNQKSEPLAIEKVNTTNQPPPPTPPYVETILEAPVIVAIEQTYPEGEFVVTERVVEFTNDGIKAFSAGERVKKVDGGYSNGKTILEVPFSKLTNSKEKGDALAKKFEEARALAYTAPTPEPPVVAPEPVQVAPTPPVLREDPRVKSIDDQIEYLEEKIKELEQKGTSRINAHGPTITRHRIQIQKLQAQKAAILVDNPR